MFINTRVLIRNVQLERKANISEEGPACPMSPTPQLIADIQQVTCVLLRIWRTQRQCFGSGDDFF